MTGVNTMIDLLDSDIKRIDCGPLAWMKAQQGKRVPLESFRQECLHRFAEAGFAVEVRTHETSQEDLYGFDLTIVGRTNAAQEFDPDQQSWEVAHNILNLPDVQEGWIPTDPGAVKALFDGDRDAKDRLH